MRDSPWSASSHFPALIRASFPPTHAFQPGHLQSLPRMGTFENDDAVVRYRFKDNLAAEASAFVRYKGNAITGVMGVPSGYNLFSQRDQHPANARRQALDLRHSIVHPLARVHHMDHIPHHSCRDSQMGKSISLRRAHICNAASYWRATGPLMSRQRRVEHACTSSEFNKCRSEFSSYWRVVCEAKFCERGHGPWVCE